MTKYKHARKVIVSVGIILGSMLVQEQVQAEPANISNSVNYRCVIKADHSVWCWGNPTPLNHEARSNPRPTTPTKFEGLQATQVASEDTLNCTLGIDQSVQCWDNNHVAANLHKIPDIKASIVRKDLLTTCVVDTDHNVRCWGANRIGNQDYGDGQVMNPNVKMKDISFDLAGGLCGIALDDSVWCWDTPYQENPAGDRPVRIPNISAKKIASIHHATCAIDKNDEAWCWGRNDSGQLGADVPGGSKTPVKVEKLNKKLVDISGGGRNFCAVDTDGAVWCWGSGSAKSLIGDSDPEYPEIPISDTNYKAVSISIDDGDICIEDTVGDLWCTPFRSPGNHSEKKRGLQKVVGINLK